MSAPGLLHVAGVLLIVFCVLALLTFAFLITLRTGIETIERRDLSREEQIRAELFALVMGEPAEQELARRQLESRPGRRGEQVEEQAFRMLAKVKGEVRAGLVGLLLARGADRRARRLIRSRSAVRRCRGAYRLGALARREDLGALLPLLRDRVFLVRRTAVRALGAIRSEAAVPALLTDVGPEHRMRRDLVAALEFIGSAAAPELRAQLGAVLAPAAAVPGEAVRQRTEVAAIALGLIGDLAAVGPLRQAVERGWTGLGVVAAGALGEIGSPDAVAVLTGAVTDGAEELRVVAAEALGKIGAPSAIDGLGAALGDPGAGTARTAATALLALGGPGHGALAASSSPYAREALALATARRERG